MSLKELTKEKHTQAESTLFMKTVFDRKAAMPMNVWSDFLYQKYLIYRALEANANKHNLLAGIESIQRAELILQDYLKLDPQNLALSRTVTDDYVKYINELADSTALFAHIYTWHLGDMYGGQMISKIIDAPSEHLKFENTQELIALVRQRLNDSMAQEANCAFDWAIKLMNEYDQYLMG